MKSIKFQDIEGQEIQVSMSSLATENAYRIYVDTKETKENSTGMCLHLNTAQVNILINGLQDLMSCRDEQ